MSLFLFLPLLIGIVAVAAVIVFAYLLRRDKHDTGSQPACRHCQATDMTEVRREPVDTRTLELASGGTMAGGDVRLQLDYDVTYHCNACHQESTFRITQTY